MAGDRRRAGAGTHTEPFRAHRAAPSTCEAGATKHQEQSDCAFGYYKEFMDSSYTVQQPPVAVSCKTPVKWLENQCLTANRGVEYDWMNFLYDINSAPAAQPRAGILGAGHGGCRVCGQPRGMGDLTEPLRDAGF